MDLPFHPSLLPTLLLAAISIPAAAAMRRAVRKEFRSLLPWLLLWGSETGLNLETSGLPMLVWVIVSAGGYTLSRHQYTRNKQRKDEAALHVENELRQHYNAAENCFLPFEYTAPAAMRELIDGLEKGTIQSFEDYRVRMV